MNVMEETLRKQVDPALTHSALSDLGSRALGRDVRARSLRVLTGGCLNRVVAVAFEGESDELVYKIGPAPGSTGIEREAAVLRYFAEHTQMRVPKPLLLDASCRIIPGPVLVMEHLDGVVLYAVWGRMGTMDRRSVLEQIARTMAALHRARQTSFGGVELPPERRHAAWPDFWIPRFVAVLSEARRAAHLPRAVLDRAEDIAAWFPRLLDIGSQAVLTHYDIWPGNILVKTGAEGARVTGYLDLPGYWADRARELSFLEMFGLAEAGSDPVYRTEHIPDDTFELRKAAYNLKMNLRHVTMYPAEVTYRDGVLDCLTTLERAV